MNTEYKKRVRKEELVTYSLIFLFIGFGIFLVYFFELNFTGFAIYEQSSESDFDEGIYSNTFWNGSAVVLSEGQTLGTYTSKVFDAGNDAIWNSLSWMGEAPSGYFSYLTSAVHSGSNRTEVFLLDDSYYLVDIKDASKNFYLNFSEDLIGEIILKIYAKKDKGVTVGIYSYEDSSGSSPLGTFTVSSSTGEWINVTLNIETPTKAIWLGEGTGSGTDPKENFDYIYAEIPSSDLNFEVRNCSSSDCLDGTWQSVDLNNINLFGKYFQFKSEFSSPVVSYTPSLSSVSIDYDLLNSAPHVVIFSPEDNGIYGYNEEIDLDFIAYDEDENLNSCWYSINDEENITLSECGNTSLTFGNSGEYILTIYANDSFGLVGSSSLSFTLTNFVPLVVLISPQEGESYGYNESIELNFVVSDVENDIDTCWYKMNDGEAILLLDCMNATFDAPEGENIVQVYANDSLGEQADDSSTFSITLGAPGISLISPIGSYSQEHEVIFKYQPEDMDLESCTLWGTFTGDWAANQTDFSPLSGSENTFNLYLEDGAYLWNIRCNDSVGNSAFNGNKSFYVDSQKPKIIISEPVGEKNSRTNIPLGFSVSDASPITCWYNVYRGENIEITNTSISNCASTTFSVTVDADFVLNLYINDSAGNFDSIISQFTISTIPVTPPTPSSGGGSSGGGGTIFLNPSMSHKLEIDSVSSFTSNKGIKRDVKFGVKNSGTGFLNKCVFFSEGDFSSWIFSDFDRNIAAGEKVSADFQVSIPKDALPGKYDFTYGIKCQEKSEEKSFSIEILEQKIGFGIIEVKRISSNQIRAVYVLEELSGLEQTVELQFLLLDLNRERIAEIKTTNTVSANSKENFEILIPVDSSLSGEFNILVNLNSETYSNFVQEDVILGAPISGFLVFEDWERGDAIASSFFILIFCIFAFFMIRRVLNYRKHLRRR